MCVCQYGSYSYLPKDFFSNVESEQCEVVLGEHNLPIDKVTTPYTCFFIDTGAHKVMVDIGAGPWVESVGKLPENLQGIGVQLSDIDVVIITHAHLDHVGGMLDGADQPVCSNVQFYIWKVE